MKTNIDFVPAELRQFFAAHPRLVLAFSGGCDSAYLLYAAAACGADVLACYVKSCFQPAFELEDAQKLAAELNVSMQVLSLDVLADENVRRNPENRCYFCKKRIFQAILNYAAENGVSCVIDGTNASDDAGDRPGMRALGEMQVLSPLRLCGIEKSRVRSLSRDAGLFTWNKPAYACLATRIPSGTEISIDMLERIERGESRLMKMGFSDFRLRLEGNGVRIEMTDDQLPLLIEKRNAVLQALETDFSQISLNLRTRKGLEI